MRTGDLRLRNAHGDPITPRNRVGILACGGEKPGHDRIRRRNRKALRQRVHLGDPGSVGGDLVAIEHWRSASASYAPANAHLCDLGTRLVSLLGMVPAWV
ncbi:hypothetical protein CK215_19855 [Mesorhizobium sp. WSM3864]|nr:hypothetical protein CK215_19855 [Mesorhizobium sp. WSM3864]